MMKDKRGQPTIFILGGSPFSSLFWIIETRKFSHSIDLLVEIVFKTILFNSSPPILLISFSFGLQNLHLSNSLRQAK